MEHTNEFLRGMFAAHMGCEVKHTYHDKDYNCNTVNLTPSRFAQISDTTTQGVEYWSSMIYFKPILTPLSEITDNDAVEVAKLYYSNKDSHTIEMGKILIAHITTPHMARKVVWSIVDAASIIDYLRSSYRLDGTPKPVYDCGYMHIQSLITAGLAIKK